MRLQRLSALFLALLPALPLQAGQAAAPVAQLSLAPGALGTARSKADLLLTASGDGKEVFLFDNQTGRFSAFVENGDPWGKPVILRNDRGQPFSAPAAKMEVGTGVVAFSSIEGVSLFKEDGTFLRRSRSFFLASDIALLPSGDWVIGLLQMPEGNGKFLGTKEGGPEAPRVVSINSKLEVGRRGLAVGDEERTGNQAAARTLRLTASRDRVFAAEVANYKLYELDKRLKLRAQYSEPSMQLENGSPGDQDAAARRAESDKKLRSAAQQSLARQGQDATAPPKTPKVEGGSFQFAQVINDIAWDPRTNGLLLLLNGSAGGAGGGNALDWFDPATGEVRRLRLHLPAGGPPGIELAQLAVGHRFIWLRGRPGSSPTFRLDRLALEQAKKVAELSVDQPSGGTAEVAVP